MLVEEIVENLASALEQFQAVAEMLSGNGANAAADAVKALLPDEENRI